MRGTTLSLTVSTRSRASSRLTTLTRPASRQATAGTARPGPDRPRFAVPRSSTRHRPRPRSGAWAGGTPSPRPISRAASAIGLRGVIPRLVHVEPAQLRPHLLDRQLQVPPRRRRIVRPHYRGQLAGRAPSRALAAPTKRSISRLTASTSTTCPAGARSPSRSCRPAPSPAGRARRPGRGGAGRTRPTPASANPVTVHRDGRDSIDGPVSPREPTSSSPEGPKRRSGQILAATSRRSRSLRPIGHHRVSVTRARYR